MLKFKNRVIFLAVKVRMRPMGHIVDLYISEILNSSVSRHITKVRGGAGLVTFSKIFFET